MNRLHLARALGHLKWFRRGARERLLQLIFRSVINADSIFEINLYGYRYAGVLNNWIDRNLYIYGGYEEEIQELLKRLSVSVRSGVFADVGANVGIHTLFASGIFDRVHAFKPYPLVRDRLVTMLQNNCVENVTVHDVGISTEDRELPFFAPPNENLGTGSFVDQYTKQNTFYQKLRVVSGDEYFRVYVGRVDVLKVDVEGYEAVVLQGLRETLDLYRPVLIVELSDSTKTQLGSLPGLLRLLPAGYRAYDIKSREIHGWLFERSRLRLTELDFWNSGNNALLIGAECDQLLHAAGLIQT